MKQGVDFQRGVEGIFGGDLDFHGHDLQKANVTNINIVFVFVFYNDIKNLM